MAIWLLAWGELSLPIAATGALLAWVLLTAFPPPSDETPTLRRIQPGPMLRLIWYVVHQLLASNLAVARQIMRRHPHIRPGVITYPMGDPSDLVVTTVTSIIALSPGMMTVNVEHHPTVITVHFLNLDQTAEARRQIARLERLTRDAFGERELA